MSFPAVGACKNLGISRSGTRKKTERLWKSTIPRTLLAEQQHRGQGDVAVDEFSVYKPLLKALAGCSEILEGIIVC